MCICDIFVKRVRETALSEGPISLYTLTLTPEEGHATLYREPTKERGSAKWWEVKRDRAPVGKSRFKEERRGRRRCLPSQRQDEGGQPLSSSYIFLTVTSNKPPGNTRINIL